jgi:hypothetical protein
VLLRLRHRRCHGIAHPLLRFAQRPERDLDPKYLLQQGGALPPAESERARQQAHQRSSWPAGSVAS